MRVGGQDYRSLFLYSLEKIIEWKPDVVQLRAKADQRGSLLARENN